MNNLDGCSYPGCKIEPGWHCEGGTADSIDTCRTICGDSLLAHTEGCDDGNDTPGDGCSATC